MGTLIQWRYWAQTWCWGTAQEELLNWAKSWLKPTGAKINWTTFLANDLRFIWRQFFKQVLTMFGVGSLYLNCKGSEPLVWFLCCAGKCCQLDNVRWSSHLIRSLTTGSLSLHGNFFGAFFVYKWLSTLSRTSVRVPCLNKRIKSNQLSII